MKRIFLCPELYTQLKAHAKSRGMTLEEWVEAATKKMMMQEVKEN